MAVARRPGGILRGRIGADKVPVAQMTGLLSGHALDAGGPAGDDAVTRVAHRGVTRQLTGKEGSPTMALKPKAASSLKPRSGEGISKPRASDDDVEGHMLSKPRATEGISKPRATEGISKPRASHEDDVEGHMMLPPSPDLGRAIQRGREREIRGSLERHAREIELRRPHKR